jgi:hypothetical protein
MPKQGSEEEQQEVKYCSSSLRRRIRQFYAARKWQRKIFVETSELKRWRRETFQY